MDRCIMGAWNEEIQYSKSHTCSGCNHGLKYLSLFQKKIDNEACMVCSE